MLNLDNEYYSGNTFVIRALDNSPQNIYIQSAKLNGEPLKSPWLYHSDLIKGGELILQMVPEPNVDWGCGDNTAPPSALQP